MDQNTLMNLAYQEALRALDEGEVPVGAVVELDGAIIGRGYNRVEALRDATAHAEIIALGAASAALGNWRLDGVTLYVTLEPCLMCLGAILQARVAKIIYAAPDPRLGAVDSHFHRQEIERAYRFFPAVKSGLMAQECTALLTSFFSRIRRKD